MWSTKAMSTAIIHRRRANSIKGQTPNNTETTASLTSNRFTDFGGPDNINGNPALQANDRMQLSE